MKRSKQATRWAWLGLVIVLTGSLDLSNFSLGRDDAAGPKKDEKRSTLASAELIIRGPERAVVGQRFTVEVFILNSGSTPLKDLEFVARPNDNLTPVEKTGVERIASIAADDLHIVRLSYTPKKAGPGGVEFSLRANNGDKEEVGHVWPVGLPDPTARTEPAQGNTFVQFKIAALRDCLVGRPAIVLIQALNTETRPMAEKLDLVVSYASMSKNSQVISGPDALDPTGKFEGTAHMKRLAAVPALIATNPTRQTKVTLPILGAGEGKTLVVRLTPRRIGDLGIAITLANAKTPQTLATARLPVKFDSDAPITQLLPVRAGATVPTRLPQKLADVPEVALEDPAPKNTQPSEGFEHIAGLIETIHHANRTKRDAYVEALARHRSDVRGLPFRMGDDCRLSPQRGQQFLSELNALRSAMTAPNAMASHLPNPAGTPALEASTPARIAALVQVVGPEGAQLGQQMVKYLATIAHVDSTRALAKLAIFSEDAAVRTDAVAALAGRPEKEVNEILLSGMNYPWPAVAERAGEAIVKLKRSALLPQLADMLDRDDPRAPQLQEKDGKKTLVVRELVKINHLRNCLLCHSPASLEMTQAAIPGGLRGDLGADEKTGFGKRGGLIAGVNTLTAPVPLPGQQVPTPTPHGGYGRFSIPDTQVAIDVTYLRQDFSVKLPVADAQPWPEVQRFDFVVRAREVTEKEAQAYRDLLRPAKADDLSPYQSAALASLKQLTGKDAKPNAAAWRSLLAQSKPVEK